MTSNKPVNITTPAKLINQDEEIKANIYNMYAKTYKKINDEILRYVTFNLLPEKKRKRHIKYLKGLQESVKIRLDELEKELNTYTQLKMNSIYWQGIKEADAVVEMLTSTAPDPVKSFGRINDQAVKVLADNMSQSTSKVTKIIGRNTLEIISRPRINEGLEEMSRKYGIPFLRNQAIRQAGLEATMPAILGIRTYTQASNELEKILKDQGLGHIPYFRKDGRFLRMVKAEEYSNVVATQVIKETLRQATSNRLAQLGYDVAEIISSKFCCDKCQVWHTKVVSLSGKDKNLPSLEQAYGSGWGHFNCKCTYGLSSKCLDYLDEVDPLD